jgi:DNA-binding SARP family transcriptional activator
MDTLQIRLLGDFSIKVREEPVAALNKPRLQSLLAYLLLHRDVPQFRYYLANLLWPDSSEAQALTNLRKLVYLITQALPPDCALIQADNQILQWNQSIAISLDVDEFHRLLAGEPFAQLPLENLEKAQSLYQGDLLPSCYEDWVVTEREHLQQVFITLLDQLVERYENLRRYPDAITCCKNLVFREPFHKDGYPRLMRLYALNEESPAALKVYHEYTRLLKHELGVEPEKGVHALYEQIKQASKEPCLPGIPGTSFNASLPLVGRGPDWQAAQSLWKTASGSPRMLLICGEAGIGKSRLAEELVNWAARQGFRTALAHCYASEGALPYAPVIEWLRASSLPTLDKVWVTELSRLLPELLKDRSAPPPPLTEAWQRMRLFEALARAVLGNRKKSLLLIEDLQWCDQDTLEWLHYLLRFDPHAPLLLVGTARSEETADNPAYTRLQSALRQEGVHLELELGPLDEHDTAHLATHAAGKPLESGLSSLIYRETEGNPLFIVETVRAELFKQGRLPGVQPLPYKARTVLEHRIQQLSAGTREIVALAATIGRAFSLEVLLQASRLAETELVTSLDELLRHRIVREIAPCLFDFSHDKLRQAVFGELSGARLQLLHRQVAEALLHLVKPDLESKSAEIAVHYEQAGSLQSAVEYYRLAAETARKIFANDLAIQHLQRALALSEILHQSDSDPALSAWEIAQLHEKLADLLALIGKYPQAQASYEQALNQPCSPTKLWRAQVYRKMSAALIPQYQHPAALEALDQAEQALDFSAADGTRQERQEWIQVQLARCDFFYWDNRADQMESILEKIRSLVESEGRADQQIDILSQEGNRRFRNERYRPSARSVEIFQHKLELAEKFGEAYSIAWSQFQLGFALLWRGMPSEGIEWLRKSLEGAAQMGARLQEVRSLAYLSVASRKLGDLPGLREYNQRLLELAPAISEYTYHGIGLANQGWLAWKEGDAEQAACACTSAVNIWAASGGEVFHGLAVWVLLAIAVGCRDLAQAERWASELLDPNPLYQPLEEKVAEQLKDALSACQAGETPRAFQLFDQTLKLARVSGDL